MGLLSGLGYGIAAEADTGGKLLVEGMKENYQTERDKATALREENLARLRASP